MNKENDTVPADVSNLIRHFERIDFDKIDLDMKIKTKELEDSTEKMKVTIEDLKRSNDRIERSHMVHTRRVEILVESEDLLERSLIKLKHDSDDMLTQFRQKCQKKLDIMSQSMRVIENEQKVIHQQECEYFKQEIERLNRGANKPNEIAFRDGRYYIDLIEPLIRDI